MERGYNVPKIIERLKEINADILLLQELDWNCERTQYKNVCKEVAEALEMNYLFVCEFVEIKHPERGNRLQGGGVHGNAILSRWNLKQPKAVTHKLQPFSWQNFGVIFGQPRLGARVAISALVDMENFGSVRLFSLHLENFSGPTGRIKQIYEIFQHCKTQNQDLVIMGGDLNTLMHGFARLFSVQCDQLRWKTLGCTEPQFWQETILSSPDEQSQRFSDVELGVPKGFLCEFFDPFDKTKDITRDQNNVYFAKLDWILLPKSLECTNFKVVNCSDISDHHLIWVTIPWKKVN